MMFDDPRVPPMPEKLRAILSAPRVESAEVDPTAPYHEMRDRIKQEQKRTGAKVTGEGPVFCPKCHKPVAWVQHGKDGGLKITQGKKVIVDLMNAVCSDNTFTVKCPDGHEVGVG
jgi:hypothetical protein